MTNDSHLERVEIRRFRGLSNLNLDGLGRFNVLLGANDVGKTSVLEAVFLLAGFVNLQLPMLIQSWRNLPIITFDRLMALFHNLDPDQQIDLVGHSSGPVVRRELKISAPNKELDLIASPPNSAGSGNGSPRGLGAVGESKNQSSSVIPMGRRVLRYDAMVRPRQGEPAVFSATLRKEGDQFQVQHIGNPGDQQTIPARYISSVPGYDSSAIGELMVRKKIADLVRHLTVINPHIKDVVTSDNVVYLDIGLDRMVPLNVFGSGMVRAANILSHCLLGNDRLLLVDELDNGLHHAAIRPLLKALLVMSRERDLQVIATTHRLAVLERLLDVLDSDEFAGHRRTTNCFTLQRDQQGRVQPYRYEYWQFEHCVRHGIEIR